ncbi:hypothetical protein QQP08_017580 [Theobroma cacao]|nr:hypothetical protein QQP08_017580 [Theobroma cacao]
MPYKIFALLVTYTKRGMRKTKVMMEYLDTLLMVRLDNTLTAYELFTMEPQNVRLGLCADGINFFGPTVKLYSIWPSHGRAYFLQMGMEGAKEILLVFASTFANFVFQFLLLLAMAYGFTSATQQCQNRSKLKQNHLLDLHILMRMNNGGDIKLKYKCRTYGMAMHIRMRQLF